jgi:hypothetical protein
MIGQESLSIISRAEGAPARCGKRENVAERVYACHIIVGSWLSSYHNRVFCTWRAVGSEVLLSCIERLRPVAVPMCNTELCGAM